MPDLIYLDHAATTRLRPEVRAAMAPFLDDLYANPSSVYRVAQTVRSKLDVARDAVARALGASPSEIIFTSGATESNNAAIKGVALAGQRRHLVTTAIEHHSVLHPMEELAARWGFDLTVVAVGADGRVTSAAIESALRPDTALVSVMWANNEIGTLQPIEEIGEILRARRIPFHVDAVQAVNYLPINLATAPIDLLSLSAHKIYGPKGSGLLYIRRGTSFFPLLTGGGQERNRRAGTENVAGIMGFAEALGLCSSDRPVAAARARRLRDRLLEELQSRIRDLRVNGSLHDRLPNNLNVTIPGCHSESLLVALDLAGVVASSGSACTSGSLDPSHVLLALGLSESEARSSLRLTLGRENTETEMVRAAETIAGAASRLRRLAPV